MSQYYFCPDLEIKADSLQAIQEAIYNAYVDSHGTELPVKGYADFRIELMEVRGPDYDDKAIKAWNYELSHWDEEELDAHLSEVKL